VSVTVGAALGRPGSISADGLVAEADLALIHAKRAGKARVQVFDACLGSTLRARHRHEDEVRRAVDAGRFALHYQPIADLRTGRLHAVEALVRWVHPERGVLPPATFIEVAERLDLIAEIGRWVIERACRDHVAWSRDGDGQPVPSISVNVSSREIGSARLAGDVAAILERTGCSGAALCFELTETGIVEDPATALDTMRALKGLGCRVALDDFGKGFSSLSQLTNFPVDVIKLDRLFVADIETSARSAALVAAVRSMAEALELTLVAEGVECEGQRRRLLELGCHIGQGYLLARPAPLDELRASPALRPATG
jgi:EAL domain-containing protein (putative c-di-GMP-specific phosphodiesterase class I)